MATLNVGAYAGVLVTGLELLCRDYLTQSTASAAPAGTMTNAPPENATPQRASTPGTSVPH